MSEGAVSSTSNRWAIRVPASSANLGAGFDVLGMALTLHALIGTGAAPPGAQQIDDHHPASIAFVRGGGEGPIWVRSSIPMGRGLGFSGTVRVGGAAAAAVQRRGKVALDDPGVVEEVLAVAGGLEGHLDNAAASLVGGVVIAAGGYVIPVPLAVAPTVVVWVPDASTTSTDQSRTTLAATISRDDAVFNIGRVAAFVAACARGDTSLLQMATEDRLHQRCRLERVPESAAALQAALEAGAWAAWLSGSGPTVASMCEPDRADEIAAALPPTGRTKRLQIDHVGATVIAVDDGIGLDDEATASAPGGS